jgi:hypothetical protein
VKNDIGAAIPGNVAWQLKLYKNGVAQGVIPVDSFGKYETVVLPGTQYSLKVEGTIDKHVTTPAPQSATFSTALGQIKTVDVIVDKKWQVSEFAGSGTGGCTSGDAGTVRFTYPTFLTYWDGFLYVVNETGNAIQKINISTGQTNILIQNNGVSGPWGITADGMGGLYVTADTNTNIVKIDIGSPSSATAFATGLNSAAGLTTAGSYLYIADQSAHNIKWKVFGSPSGEASIFVGSQGTGVNPPQFDIPRKVVAEGGFLYVADSGNHVIRKIDIATGVGTILAGMMGSASYADGTGTAAKFNQPYEVVPDGAGNLYVSCSTGTQIRKIEIATGKVTTIAREGVTFSSVWGMCVVNGDIYATDPNANKIKKLTRNW